MSCVRQTKLVHRDCGDHRNWVERSPRLRRRSSRRRKHGLLAHYWRMGTANRVASVLVVLYTILWVRRSRCRGPSCQLGMRARRCVANEGVDVLRLSEAGGADGMPCGGLVNLLLPWCRECPRSHGRGQLSHHAHACVGALSHADVVAGAGAGCACDCGFCVRRR